MSDRTWFLHAVAIIGCAVFADHPGYQWLGLGMVWLILGNLFRLVVKESRTKTRNDRETDEFIRRHYRL